LSVTGEVDWWLMGGLLGAIGALGWGLTRFRPKTWAQASIHHFRRWGESTTPYILNVTLDPCSEKA